MEDRTNLLDSESSLTITSPGDIELPVMPNPIDHMLVHAPESGAPQQEGKQLEIKEAPLQQGEPDPNPNPPPPPPPNSPQSDSDDDSDDEIHPDQPPLPPLAFALPPPAGMHVLVNGQPAPVVGMWVVEEVD